MLLTLVLWALPMLLTAQGAAPLPEGVREGFTLVDIPGYEDCTLKSIFFDPVVDGADNNPLIIFISSWCALLSYLPLHASCPFLSVGV